VKRYKKSELEEVKDIAIEIFGNLNNINDIINLKNHPKRFDFITNNKFNKLYNIIPALEELNVIIGMDNVKEKIFRSICYFLHDINERSSNNEMNHIMIMGPPGVGKTTVAKIMANIYLRLGFLENDTFITATRSDLIAKYLGQTADKTQKVIDSALGGVLFIDEVYSLGNKEGRDSFAKECIDTINLNMSRTDRPWLLIVGGYKEEIEDSFLAYNKGLERRFTIKLEINGYNDDELLSR
jgi:SpoVK/Ycf46/Vps4 family AAA+-type ATPase